MAGPYPTIFATRSWRWPIMASGHVSSPASSECRMAVSPRFSAGTRRPAPLGQGPLGAANPRWVSQKTGDGERSSKMAVSPYLRTGELDSVSLKDMFVAEYTVSLAFWEKVYHLHLSFSSSSFLYCGLTQTLWGVYMSSLKSHRPPLLKIMSVLLINWFVWIHPKNSFFPMSKKIWGGKNTHQLFATRSN